MYWNQIVDHVTDQYINGYSQSVVQTYRIVIWNADHLVPVRE